jgi:hypothetical protein
MSGARYSILRSPYWGLPWVNHRDWPECAETHSERALHVQISAVSYDQPIAANLSRVRPALRKAANSRPGGTASPRRRVTNEASRKGTTIPCSLRSGTDPAGQPFAAEEQRALQCLGAALVVHWNAMPTTLQREIFDTAGSVGRLVETAALRGQIARFLHKHSEASRGKLPLTRDARWGAAALSRWDNKGGAVRDGLRM